MALLFGVVLPAQAQSNADPASERARKPTVDAITAKIVAALSEPAKKDNAQAIEDEFKTQIAAAGHAVAPADLVAQDVWNNVSAQLLGPLLQKEGMVPSSDEGKNALASFANDVGMGAGGTTAPAPATAVPDSQALKTFDTTYSSKAVLATAQVFNGYFDLPHNNSVSLKISASLPAGTNSLGDYANNELLLPDGGFLNVYFSFAAAKPSVVRQGSEARRHALNRHYLGGQDALTKTTEQDATHLYFTNGLGMKAVKTSLATGNVSLTGVGTAYLGVGMDANLYDPNNLNNQGSFSIELTAAGNATSHQALRSLYGATNPALPSSTTFETWGAHAKIYVANEVFLSVGYYKPINRSARDLIHEVTSFSIGYNLGASKPASGDPPRTRGAN